jgi:SAM-dependent methyltransferase
MEAVCSNRADHGRRHRSGLRARLAPTYETFQELAVGDVGSVLDVGCGADSPLGRFAATYPRTVGVDLCAEAVAASRAAGIHDEYVLLDVLGIGSAFEPGSFDAVVAFDVIEHLERDDGFQLLRTMERIARRRVVVFTPNGFLRQAGTADNSLQSHRSGWTAEDFQLRGYDVSGIHGLKVLRGHKGSIRWRPRRLWGIVSDLTQPYVHRRPSLAFHLLCVKEVGSAVSPS